MEASSFSLKWHKFWQKALGYVWPKWIIDTQQNFKTVAKGMLSVLHIHKYKLHYVKSVEKRTTKIKLLYFFSFRFLLFY